MQDANRIKISLEIENDKFGSGVNNNDLLIIAHAKYQKITLVSQESWQPTPPEKKKNYKIPRVCAKERVSCINFLVLLNEIQSEGGKNVH